MAIELIAWFGHDEQFKAILAVKQSNKVYFKRREEDKMLSYLTRELKFWQKKAPKGAFFYWYISRITSC